MVFFFPDRFDLYEKTLYLPPKTGDIKLWCKNYILPEKMIYLKICQACNLSFILLKKINL